MPFGDVLSRASTNVRSGVDAQNHILTPPLNETAARSARTSLELVNLGK